MSSGKGRMKNGFSLLVNDADKQAGELMLVTSKWSSRLGILDIRDHESGHSHAGYFNDGSSKDGIDYGREGWGSKDAARTLVGRLGPWERKAWSANESGMIFKKYKKEVVYISSADSGFKGY